MSTWNTPITWVAGTVATAANLNTLRDNALWLRGAFTINGITSDTQRFIQAGTNNITMGGVATDTTAISFPTTFAASPVVVCGGGDATAPKISFRATSITTSGFTLRASTGDGTTSAATVSFWWIAVNVP